MTVGYINNMKLLLKLNNEKEKILNKYKFFSSQEQQFSSQEEFEWSDMQDRIALVKDCGFICSREVINPDCENCSAKKWCDRYKDKW